MVMEIINAQSSSVVKENVIDEQSIHQLFELGNRKPTSLFAFADQIRKKQVGEAIHLRAIVEFSNYCACQCLYCGLRSGNNRVTRYRLSQSEILQSVQKAVNLGFKTIILQSGEDPFYRVDDIAFLIESIKNRFDVAVTLSIGEYPRQAYQLWRNAGADRYLLKHETADEMLYQKLRPGKKLSNRIQCLLDLKDLGYQIGSGNMVGLPGQTSETLAKDILLLKKLDVAMAGIGPFLPHPDTPLRSSSKGSPMQTLKTLAITRVVVPTVHLPATTALGSLNQKARFMALETGANVIMISFTPSSIRDQYSIYPQKNQYSIEPEIFFKTLKTALKKMNRMISKDYGHAIKNNKKTEVYYDFN